MYQVLFIFEQKICSIHTNLYWNTVKRVCRIFRFDCDASKLIPYSLFRRQESGAIKANDQKSLPN